MNYTYNSRNGADLKTFCMYDFLLEIIILMLLIVKVSIPVWSKLRLTYL